MTTNLLFTKLLISVLLRKKTAQNAVIMSCQMPITGNSAPQRVVDETVTQRLPASASLLLFHATFEELDLLYIYIYIYECHAYQILMGFDLFDECAACEIYHSLR